MGNDRKRFEEFIENEYKQYEWFFKDGRWRSDWLEALANSEEMRRGLNHKVVLNSDKVQYQNWDEKAIIDAYGAQNRLEVYEGMAKWVEIQYLLYLNETAYGKREEIRTMLRQDEYGRGFIQYRKKYALSYNQEQRLTPFKIFPPL